MHPEFCHRGTSYRGISTRTGDHTTRVLVAAAHQLPDHTGTPDVDPPGKVSPSWVVYTPSPWRSVVTADRVRDVHYLLNVRRRHVSLLSLDEVDDRWGVDSHQCVSGTGRYGDPEDPTPASLERITPTPHL